MSDLRTALLVIGVSLVAVIYAYGWWQQRRYQRKFGSAFKAGHEDVLYQESASGSSARQRQPELASMADKPGVLPAAGHLLPALLDESCELLDVRTDFIIELHLEEPAPASVLDGLWQRKFDFGKPVQVCGLTLAGKHWERVIAEGHALYARFRIALQLADRGGVVSAAKLADFRDLVLGVANHIKANITVPDLNKAHQVAVDLDAFCAEVDQMIGVNLVAQGERTLSGASISQAADTQGMTLESDGAFHLLDSHGHSLFTLTNQDSRPFQRHMLESFNTSAITMLLDVPRVESPVLYFDQMMRVARELARELQLNVVDDNRVVLGDASLARIRAQIVEIDAKMCERGIKPGSANARRLFS